MSYSEQLKEWIGEHAVQVSWGEFSGVNDLELAQLGALQALVQAAIAEKIRDIPHKEPQEN